MFIQSLKEDTVVNLLDILNLGYSGKQKIDPDYLGAIIDELNSRELSEAEAKEFDNILKFATNDSIDDSVTKPENSKKATLKAKKTDITVKGNDREPGRYTALKLAQQLISILGYIVIIFGIITSIFLISESEEQVLFGIAVFVVSVIIALPLLAYSNLISVFIDIEYNTRKTKEAIEKVSK
jgi:hypothetical protein